MTADLLDGFGAKGINEHSEPKAGNGKGDRKYRTSRSQLPYVAEADDGRVRAVAISARPWALLQLL